MAKCRRDGIVWMCSPAGGRVTGPAVITELITELHASVDAAAGFEGEMQNLASYAAALALALECIRECGDSRWDGMHPLASREMVGSDCPS